MSSPMTECLRAVRKRLTAAPRELAGEVAP